MSVTVWGLCSSRVNAQPVVYYCDGGRANSNHYSRRGCFKLLFQVVPFQSVTRSWSSSFKLFSRAELSWNIIQYRVVSEVGAWFPKEVNNTVCSGSVVVTAYDSESGRPSSNPEWGQYTMRLRSLHRAYPSLHPFGVVHWVPEQLNIKAVTEACKLIDGCSLVLCLATPSVVPAGICHRNKVDSIAWLYRNGPSHKIVWFTLHYITKTF